MIKRMRFATGLAVVVVTTVLVAGCGGTKSLSHSALITRANRVCRTASAAVSKLGVPATSISGLTKYASQVLPISKKMATQLSSLSASSSDKASLNSLVAAVQNGNQGLTLMTKATTTAQTTKAGQLILAKPVPTAANALGATACAASPTA